MAKTEKKPASVSGKPCEALQKNFGIARLHGCAYPRFQFASRSRTRMTVLADHGEPLGVSTLRALSSAAAVRADMLAEYPRTGII